MINYDWNCRTVDAYVEKDKDSDVVYNVHWIVTGVLDNEDPEGNAYSITTIGTQVLNTSTIVDFIPFSDITNEEVVSWTKAAMGEDQVNSIESSIASQIDALVNPVTVTLTVGDPVPPVTDGE
jgi:hypothetical protein